MNTRTRTLAAGLAVAALAATHEARANPCGESLTISSTNTTGDPAVIGITSATSNSQGVVGVATDTNCSQTMEQNVVTGVYGEGDYSGAYGGYFIAKGDTVPALYGNASATGGTGVLGTGYGYGVEGSSSSGYGVYGVSSGTFFSGVYGVANSSASYGVFGKTGNNSGAGVAGENTGSGDGVYGVGTNGAGVYGTSTGYDGVHGQISVTTAAGVSGVNTGTSGNSVGVYGATSSSSGYAGYFQGNVHVTGTLTCGSGCTSDVRLKKDIQPMSGALDQLLQLHGVTYHWIDPSQHMNDASTQHGFIAQDVEKIFPTWVNDNGYTGPDGIHYRTMDLKQIEALEVESIRTLKMENDALSDRVAALESGRQLRVSGVNVNGIGFGVGGLAIAGAMFASRKRRGTGAQTP